MSHSSFDVSTTIALVVVSAKEHGKVYTLQNGQLNIATYTAEHPPTYSDNEGFFTRSGGGVHYGSGNVREESDQHNLNEYSKAISGELSDLLKIHQPEVMLLIEPEHLQGLVEEHLVNPNHIPLITVKYGNHVQDDPDEIMNILRAHTQHQSTADDPGHPDSVAGEENAEEKRKILSVGRDV